MRVPGLRSAYEKVGGLYFFGRMLDKIRLRAAGQLPADYHLGDRDPRFYDGRCTRFLGVDYHELARRVLEGGTDEDILAWCLDQGRRPTEEEIETWNGFLAKRGWRDDTSERLAAARANLGLGHRTDLQTWFDLQDADEGRPPRSPQPGGSGEPV